MKGVNWIGLYTLIARDVHRTFRVAVQTLVTPWITAFLYIFIFGSVIGSRIGEFVPGISYIAFVLPGILMMSVLMGSFMSASNGLYFKRFLRDIEEILVAPLSYLEMIIGFIVSAVIRALIIAIGIYIIAIFFGGSNIDHLFLFLFYVIATSAVFALLGLIVGLWANGFEQLNVWTTFVITPLSFLGGVFYSVSMLPPAWAAFTYWNPFFYFMDGIRFSMIGYSEAPNEAIGLIMISALLISLGTLVWYLFKIGWRLRE